MGGLAEIGIFFAGLGVMFAGLGVLYWASVADKKARRGDPRG